MNAAFELDGVTAVRGTQTILKDLRQLIPQQQVIALVGPNGAAARRSGYARLRYALRIGRKCGAAYTEAVRPKSMLHSAGTFRRVYLHGTRLCRDGA